PDYYRERPHRQKQFTTVYRPYVVQRPAVTAAPPPEWHGEVWVAPPTATVEVDVPPPPTMLVPAPPSVEVRAGVVVPAPPSVTVRAGTYVPPPPAVRVVVPPPPRVHVLVGAPPPPVIVAPAPTVYVRPG